MFAGVSLKDTHIRAKYSILYLESQGVCRFLAGGLQFIRRNSMMMMAESGQAGALPRAAREK